eukprot:scaffold1852_cov282-Prasinococcus_capsulatus_cf.AAC.1
MDAWMDGGLAADAVVVTADGVSRREIWRGLIARYARGCGAPAELAAELARLTAGLAPGDMERVRACARALLFCCCCCCCCRVALGSSWAWPQGAVGPAHSLTRCTLWVGRRACVRSVGWRAAACQPMRTCFARRSTGGGGRRARARCARTSSCSSSTASARGASTRHRTRCAPPCAASGARHVTVRRRAGFRPRAGAAGAGGGGGPAGRRQRAAAAAAEQEQGQDEEECDGGGEGPVLGVVRPPPPPSSSRSVCAGRTCHVGRGHVGAQCLSIVPDASRQRGARRGASSHQCLSPPSPRARAGCDAMRCDAMRANPPSVATRLLADATPRASSPCAPRGAAAPART